MLVVAAVIVVGLSLVAWYERLKWLGAADRADWLQVRVDEQHEAWGRDMDTWLKREQEWRREREVYEERLEAMREYGRQVKGGA